MRFWLVFLLVFATFPACAETPAAPVNTIPLDGVWRSDAGLIQAETLIKEKKYSDALTMLDQVTARNMNNADAHALSAMAWLNLGNLEKAEDEADATLMLDKMHLGGYVIKGLIAMMNQDPDKASDYLGILHMLCKSDNCPEYQTLQRIIRETKITPKDGGWFF